MSYEIPIQGLIYIRLSEDLYMNTSLGIAVNWYASDVRSVGPNGILVQTSERAQWANFSLLANIGFEYRTKNREQGMSIFFTGSHFFCLVLTFQCGTIEEVGSIDHRK